MVWGVEYEASDDERDWAYMGKLGGWIRGRFFVKGKMGMMGRVEFEISRRCH